MDNTSPQHLQLSQDLPSSIENGDIYWVYQAQYDYENKKYICAEMLARWEHPKYGNISPETFIPIAENTGMIAPLTVKLLIEASKAFKLLEAYNINHFSLSINISPIFLMSKTFYNTIEFIIMQYHLNNHKLHFEITEQILIQDIHLYRKLFNKLKKLHIHLALDDFGTGYTSFNYLSELPIDTIKIDKSLIKNIHQNKKNRSIVKAICMMAQVLDISIVIEGIEKEEENKSIEKLNYIKSQGYYHSTPAPLKQLIAEYISM